MKTFLISILTIALSASLTAATFLGWQPAVPSGALRITQIDNPGEIGDIYLIQAPDGKTTLVDAGMVHVGETVLIPALDKRGIKVIDQVILTHQHDDHTGGLPTLLADPEITVKRILWSPLPDEQVRKATPQDALLELPLDRAYLTLAARKAIPVQTVKAGNVLDFGSGIQGVVVAAARPGIAVPSLQNNNSIVFRLTYGNFTMLFTGDCNFQEEKVILASGAAIAADVLKAGHHGGAGSSSEEFLAAVHPQIVVSPMPDWLSADPRGKRLEAYLNARQIPYFRSWEQGDMVIFSDGHSFGLCKTP